MRHPDKIDTSLYETHRTVHNKRIDGPFRRFKWLVMAVTLSTLVLGPMLTTDPGYWLRPQTWTYWWSNAFAWRLGGIVFGALYSLLLFGDDIPLYGWLGMGLICASGIAATVLRARAGPDAPAEEH